MVVLKKVIYLVAPLQVVKLLARDLQLSRPSLRVKLDILSNSLIFEHSSLQIFS